MRMRTTTGRYELLVLQISSDSVGRDSRSTGLFHNGSSGEIASGWCGQPVLSIGGGVCGLDWLMEGTMTALDTGVIGLLLTVVELVVSTRIVSTWSASLPLEESPTLVLASPPLSAFTFLEE